MEKSFITVKQSIMAPLERVWECWTNPEHITQWNAASDDWHTPQATNDLREGGTFTSRMEAKDGSVGFDFAGTYTSVIPHKKIAYVMEDGRTVEVDFEDLGGGEVTVRETFQAEQENPLDMQKQGWQAILDRFKGYVEANNG